MAKHMPTVHQCQEMLALKEYVTARDSTRYDGMAEGNLRLDVSHSNLVQRWHDILFNEDMTILEVKEKLFRHGGTSVAWQELYLRRGGSDTIFLMDESKSLRHYGARSGMEIHIKDLDPHSLSRHGGLEDVSQVEKYVMADEAYGRLQNSVRAQRRAAQEAAARGRATQGQEPDAQAAGPLEMTAEEAAAAFPLGSRCECDPGARRGEVCYVGPVLNAKGMWVGIRLDEPQGQNDGTKDGRSYFDCRPKYGCFARPVNVRVGDYPERDPLASDDEF
uniref:CAP-Gly domain-containing protein n=1 Tax=Pyrodinium bahamense TaxID=73915 RepID=A0A7S0AUB8_9DINO